ncbi:MAG: putative lipid II flippase FtsW [Oscillospiraceae bacterium]|nr:putative lipid II flippase FtsW [Oscillospiraceae bacterium]MBR2977860.1 putative lipid II flippase FtsW [Oscillospiraceae bacterium]
MDLPFLLLTLILMTLGLIMMLSASYARAYQTEGNALYFFIRQAIFAALGITGMLIVSKIDYELWRAFSFPFLVGAVVLMVLVLLIGTAGGGAKRWILIGGVSIQPSELVKMAVVIFFATLISSFKDKMETFKFGILPFAAVLLGLAVILILQRHFSAIIIICLLGAVMLFLGGVKFRWFVALGILAFAAGLIYISSMGYASERITAWRDPFADPSDTGYQVVQSLYAIGSGGLFGLGFGRSRQKYLYLPEEHNDYIFSVVCEELGFIGALLIILLFVPLIIRGFWIAMHAKDRFGALLAGGFTSLLAIQVFFNIGVVTNFLPSTGISLPFFSYGGTALLVQLAEMGVILSVSRDCDTLLK